VRQGKSAHVASHLAAFVERAVNYFAVEGVGVLRALPAQGSEAKPRDAHGRAPRAKALRSSMFEVRRS
jgi:hypothetical protein